MTDHTATNTNYRHVMRHFEHYRTALRASNVPDHPNQDYHESEHHGSKAPLPPQHRNSPNYSSVVHRNLEMMLETARSSYHRSNQEHLTQDPATNREQNHETPTPVLGLPVTDALHVPKHDMYEDHAMPDRHIPKPDTQSLPQTTKSYKAIIATEDITDDLDNAGNDIEKTLERLTQYERHHTPSLTPT